MPQRPDKFTLNRNHHLAKGLVFAGLGTMAGGTHYHDSSVYGRHGVLTNMDPLTDWLSVSGRKALDFDGSNDYINLNKALNIATDVTITAFVEFYDTTNDHALIGNWNGAGGEDGSWMLWFDDVVSVNSSSPDKLGFTWRSSSSTGTNWHWTHCSTQIQANTLYHVAVVLHRGVESRVFINGYDDTGFQQQQTMVTATAPVSNVLIGQNNGDTRKHFGLLSDVCVWNLARSTSEISELADPSNVMLSGLILPPARKWWPVVSGGTPPATFKAFWANRATQVAA